MEPKSLAEENWIDEEINATLSALGLPPSPPADDATFLRRARLDLTGRLPTPDEVRSFLADPDASKRGRLVDQLLRSDDFTEYWTFKLATLLRIRPQPGDSQGAEAFHRWVRQCLANGTPYDDMARSLLTADGDSHEVGPANFYRVTAGPREQAEYVSELFLGVRLRCANCHNHPLDRWTQDDYHGLAAIFARVEQSRHVRVRERGEVIHPATGKPAAPRIPGERFLSEEVDGRDAFANWLIAADNPYFARAVVNRLWKALMGRGLIEPTDELRATNPATHPHLLDRLAEDFANHGYDLRHTLRLIATSAAYARSSRPTEENAADDRFYSHALSRPLEPEVFLDAVSDVTGVWDQFGEHTTGARAIALVDPQTPSASLDILGRCSRADSCEDALPTAGLTAQLHFLNGPLINRKVASPEGRLHAALSDKTTSDEIVTEFYLRALNRYPTAEEITYWRDNLKASTAHRRRAPWEDFLWSLLNSQEFGANH